jgi:glycosyltransferase involved in cell wall biosynthesis
VLGDLLAHLDPAIEVTVLAPFPPVGAELAARRPGARLLAAGGIADKRDLAGMRRWLGALRAARADIVQLNLTMPWSFRHETLLALAMPGVRVIAVEHSPLPFDSTWMRRLKPVLARGLAAHVAVGEGAARTIERHAGLPPGAVRAIPIGVEPFPAPPRGTPGRRIGTIARLDPVKRLDDLLRAVAVLPDVELEIVGDGPERGSLEALAASLGVSVHFAGWAADTREWLALWDALVLPSSTEGLPLVVLDALLAGVPVVATPVGSVPEAVEPEVTGLLVEVGDVAGLATTTSRLLDDPELARRLAAAGRERVLARFTADRMARRYEALYAELLTG